VIRETTRQIKHGLAFYGTLAFVAGFFGARLFATLNPSVVVETRGIHFHHFWYGVAMVELAGWLGITMNDNKLDHYFAVVFGLGTGFIGDEVGLLLTFGDYSFRLALMFFVAAVSFIILASLFTRYHEQLEKDVLTIGIRQHLSRWGLFLVGFSTIFFAFGLTAMGLAVAGLGLVMFLVGFEIRRHPTRLRNLLSP
jgi:FtsH-binding integral membrane protein